MKIYVGTEGGIKISKRKTTIVAAAVAVVVVEKQLKKEKNGEVVMNKNTGRDKISLSSGLGPKSLQNQRKKINFGVKDTIL